MANVLGARNHAGQRQRRKWSDVVQKIRITDSY